MSASEPPNTVITYSPAIPIPGTFDLQAYIARLKDFLNPQSPHYERPQHHINVKKLIELYESGERKDSTTAIYISKGEVITEAQFWANPKEWCYIDISSNIICQELLLTWGFRGRFLIHITAVPMVVGRELMTPAVVVIG